MASINKKNYDILIVSEDYPGNGGFGTYGYNLFREMIKNNFNVALLYFSKLQNLKFDPPNENIYYIYIPNFSTSVNMITDGSYHSSILENNIITALINFNINSAKIVISISPSTMFLVNKYISTKYHIYRIGHIHFNKLSNINNLWKTNPTTIKDIIRPNYISDKIMQNNPNIMVIPNSPLTEVFIKTLKTGMNFKNKIFNNMIGLSYNFIKNDPVQKKYDIIFIASNICRREKNFAMAKKIFQKYPNSKKMLVGHNTKQCKNQFANTKIYEFLPNEKLLKKIAKSKILLMTSLLDAGPNVVIESIIESTIPVMSLNTGFASLFNSKYVCNPKNEDEWITKIQNILDNYNTINFNKEFSNIINKIIDDKNKFFDLITSLLLECKIKECKNDNGIVFIDHTTGDYNSINLTPLAKINLLQ